MFGKMKTDLQNLFVELKQQGLYKSERIITTPQGASIGVSTGKAVMNFCANNYLGLSSHPSVVQAAHEGLDTRGYGMSSVRFICGTQDIHRELEDRLSAFLGTEATILFPSCMDANAGVFEAILGKDDVMISDRLVHASIIDGIRLCSAVQDTFKHSNMEHLEEKLQLHADKRCKVISTDGVFSMDGDMAKLPQICDLAEKYNALVMVDDSHATGYIGPHGRGTPEQFGVQDRVDIVTSTLGKAMGGANGGFTSGRKEIIELLRQRSRPYLFSNTVAPAVVGASIKVIELLSGSTELRDRVWENARYFRTEMIKAGFDIVEGNTAIVPVMLYDEPLAIKMADMLLEEGIYVIGFVYPVVPKGKARIRVQLSAAHGREDLDKAIAAFVKVGKELQLV